MKVGIKIASPCVVNAATVRCYKQSVSGPWQVGDTSVEFVYIVQHSSEAHITVLLTMAMLSRDTM